MCAQELKLTVKGIFTNSKEHGLLKKHSSKEQTKQQDSKFRVHFS